MDNSGRPGHVSIFISSQYKGYVFYDDLEYFMRLQERPVRRIKKPQGRHQSPYELRVFFPPRIMLKRKHLAPSDMHVTFGFSAHKGLHVYHRPIKGGMDPEVIFSLLRRSADFLVQCGNKRWWRSPTQLRSSQWAPAVSTACSDLTQSSRLPSGGQELHVH